VSVAKNSQAREKEGDLRAKVGAFSVNAQREERGGKRKRSLNALENRLICPRNAPVIYEKGVLKI